MKREYIVNAKELNKKSSFEFRKRVNQDLRLECGSRHENIRKELLYKLQKHYVLCATVTIKTKNCDYTVNLPCNYNRKDWVTFLYTLNIYYDSGLGQQYVFGVIWFTDNSFLERKEYDGMERWEHRKRPIIPEVLKL